MQFTDGQQNLIDQGLRMSDEVDTSEGSSIASNMNPNFESNAVNDTGSARSSTTHDTRPYSQELSSSSRVESLNKREGGELSPDLVKFYTLTFKMWEVTKPKKHILAKNLGTVMRALLKNPSERQLKQYMEQLELSGEFLSLEKFLLFMAKCDCPDYDDKKTLLRAFEMYDPDQHGYLTVSNFRHILSSYGDPNDISLEEIEDIVKTFGELIPPIPNTSVNSLFEKGSTGEPNQQTEPEKVIFYGKFIKACLSNTKIHEKPVKRKKRAKSKSPTKR